MRIRIYSLKKTLYEGDARAVNCPTTTGQITILDHHRPLITILAAGILTVTDVSGDTLAFPITDGFLEIQPGNTGRILVEE